MSTTYTPQTQTLREAVAALTPRELTIMALQLRETAMDARRVGAHRFANGLTYQAQAYAQRAQEGRR